MTRTHYGKCYHSAKNDSDVWIPVELRRRHTKPNQDAAKTANLAHELAVADVYCAIFPHTYEDGSRVLEFWERSLLNETYTATRYDASLILFGQPFFLEVERGNHAVLSQEQANSAKADYYRSSLNYKIDRYIEYYRQNDSKPFKVLITVEDWSAGHYDAAGTRRLVADVQELVNRFVRHRGDNSGVTFLVARHRDVVGDRDGVPGEIHNEVLGDPFGEVWFHPQKQGYISLRDV